jgi:hypothetical protein
MSFILTQRSKPKSIPESGNFDSLSGPTPQLYYFITIFIKLDSRIHMRENSLAVVLREGRQKTKQVPASRGEIPGSIIFYLRSCKGSGERVTLGNFGACPANSAQGFGLFSHMCAVIKLYENSNNRCIYLDIFIISVLYYY